MHKHEMSETNNTQSNPWLQPSAHQRQTILNSKKTGARKVVNGKLIQVKSPIDRIDRSMWCLHFIRQLEQALFERAREEESFWIAGLMSQTLANRVEKFHSDVITVIDQTTNHGLSGAPPALQNAKRLLPLISSFKLRCNASIKSVKQLELAMSLWDLCDDVEHYVTQTSMTYGLVAVNGGKPRLGNRPTNSDAKKAYGSLIENHQQLYGKKSFPKPSIVHKTMTDVGHDVSIRTLNLWKNQIVNGTFSWHVQSKNRQ